MTKDAVILNAEQIQRILPQRYPFVMIDRVTKFEKGERLVAVKSISVNEWFSEATAAFGGIVPPTLLVEAAAQAALLLYQMSMVKEGEHPRYILGRMKAEFFEDVTVGDEVEVVAEKGRLLSNGGYADVNIVKCGKIVCKTFLIFSVLTNR